MTGKKCPVCGNSCREVFRQTVLGRHSVAYFQCESCLFLFTDSPHWLAEAYGPLSADVDTSLVARPLSMREPVCKLIRRHLDPSGDFLDFGGGSGLFTRLMRDHGYNFFHHDKFSPNLFARSFNVNSPTSTPRHFDLVTAFEVMEHLPTPLQSCKELLSASDNLLFTTELLPSNDAKELISWPYLGTDHGQHVSFFHRRSLEAMAKKLEVTYIRCGESLHLFSRHLKRVNLATARFPRTMIYRQSAKALNRLFSTENYWIRKIRRPNP